MRSHEKSWQLRRNRSRVILTTIFLSLFLGVSPGRCEKPPVANPAPTDSLVSLRASELTSLLDELDHQAAEILLLRANGAFSDTLLSVTRSMNADLLEYIEDFSAMASKKKREAALVVVAASLYAYLLCLAFR